MQFSKVCLELNPIDRKPTSKSCTIASFGAPGNGVPLNSISRRCSPLLICGGTSFNLLLDVISKARGRSPMFPLISPGPASAVSKLILFEGCSFNRPISSHTADQPPTIVNKFVSRKTLKKYFIALNFSDCVHL